MGRKHQDPDPDAPGPEGIAAISAAWEACTAGERVAKGVFSIWKAEDGGLHISYRPDGAEEDSHLPVPATLLQMVFAAAEGRGPLGRLRALAVGLGGGS